MPENVHYVTTHPWNLIRLVKYARDLAWEKYLSRFTRKNSIQPIKDDTVNVNCVRRENWFHLLTTKTKNYLQLPAV